MTSLHTPPNAQDEARQSSIAVCNPVTQETIGHIPRHSPQQVAAALARARAAQPSWAALGVRERVRVLRRWQELLWERQEEGIAVLRRENGKSQASALLEFLVIDHNTQYLLHHAARFLKPQRRPALFPVIQRGKVLRKPHGVVGIITPWNYPFALPFLDMVPALLAGNAAVLKPSEYTPFVAEFGLNLLYEAGLPRDVAQIVHGAGETGAALVDAADFVQFTGSTPVGRKVGVRCAERLIPCSLELGGKDPALVLADADLDMAAVALLQGAFENAGQMCISVERVYVEDSAYEPLIERLLHHAQRLQVGAGDSLEVVMGSMTNARELERTQQHIQDALAKGARLLYGGRARPDLGPLFHEPTILADVTHAMDIMQEETFGPVLPLMRVGNAEEALRLANDSPYGLSASIYSQDLARAEQLAARLDAGDVSVNRAQFAIATPSLPTGGQRASGLGRRNGKEGLLKYTTSQALLLDTLLGAETSLTLTTPRVLRLIKLLRRVRRYVPFV